MDFNYIFLAVLVPVPEYSIFSLLRRGTVLGILRVYNVRTPQILGRSVSRLVREQSRTDQQSGSHPEQHITTRLIEDCNLENS